MCSLSDEAGTQLIKEGILDRQYYEESYLPSIVSVASIKLGKPASCSEHPLITTPELRPPILKPLGKSPKVCFIQNHLTLTGPWGGLNRGVT